MSKQYKHAKNPLMFEDPPPMWYHSWNRERQHLLAIEYISIPPEPVMDAFKLWHQSKVIGDLVGKPCTWVQQPGIWDTVSVDAVHCSVHKRNLHKTRWCIRYKHNSQSVRLASYTQHNRFLPWAGKSEMYQGRRKDLWEECGNFARSSA